jgi:superfamily II DNA or RNA helicase
MATARGFQEFDRQLGVLPTGGGKSICFAALAKRFLEKRNERTLILAHREELVQQAVDKIYKATGLVAEIEKAEQRASLTAPVVVGSVQTLQGSRLERWPQDHFGLVVADEAHHAIADSWQSTLAWFHERAKVLGVTATPGRGDKKNLGRYFQNICYEIGLIDLIQRGYLCPIVIRTVPLKIDLGEVKSTNGDYDANQLSEAIEPLLRGVVQELIRCAGNRKILVFLPLIKTSKVFVDLCREVGLTARHVDGEMEERKSVLAAYARNEFQVLSNAMLLLEGYDQPDIDCVVMLRPTRSTALYAQAIGRGTRIAQEKNNLLLLDFLWLHEKHNLIRPAHLIAKDEAEAKAMTKASAAGGDAAQDLLELQEKAVADREAALAEEVAKMAKRQSRIISLEEVAVALHQPDIVDYEPTMGWHSLPPTTKQVELLKKHRIPQKAIKNRGHATELINRIFDRRNHHLASINQVIWLRRMGYPQPEKATFEEAKAFLNEKWGKLTKQQHRKFFHE